MTALPVRKYARFCEEIAPAPGLADYYPTARVPPMFRFGAAPNGQVQLVDGDYFEYTAWDGSDVEMAVGRYRTSGGIHIERPVSEPTWIYFSSNGGSLVEWGIGGNPINIAGTDPSKGQESLHGGVQTPGLIACTGEHVFAPLSMGNGALLTWTNPGGPGNPTLVDVPLVDLQNEIFNVIGAAGLTPTTGALELLTALKLLFYSTGDVKATFKTVADIGWVLMDDGKIGNAASLASTRANADTAALFTLLYNNISVPSTNLLCIVSGGLAANAAAAFAANKTLELPKSLGRALASAGAGASLSARVLGDVFGEENHPLSVEELAIHDHIVGDTSTGVSIIFGGNSVPYWGSGGSNARATATAGNGDPHNTMQPTTFMNFMIKL